MKVKWVESPDLYDSEHPTAGLVKADPGAAAFVARFHEYVLDLIESGEVTEEQSRAVARWADENRCPECGR